MNPFQKSPVIMTDSTTTITQSGGRNKQR
jgi:hypothetical protein